MKKKKANKKEIEKLANDSILKSLRGRLIGDMKPEAFVYWLQGFLELENPKSLTVRQTQIVKDHLALVFHKATPNRNTSDDFDLGESNHRAGLPHFCSSGSLKVC
jgi:hypothetical protein